jgi:hypothetical protein
MSCAKGGGYEGLLTGRLIFIGARILRGALVNQNRVWTMTTHYKGQRISELLSQIREFQVVLELNKDSIKTAEELVQYVQGEAELAIMKAKLTALQGDDK